MANPESVRRAGTVRTVRSSVYPGVVESVVEGYIVPATLLELNRQLGDVLGKGDSASRWLMDTVGAIGFSPQIVHSASVALRLFRAQGGQHLYLATPLSGLRMLTSALVIATQVQVVAFPTIVSARTALRASIATSR